MKRCRDFSCLMIITVCGSLLLTASKSALAQVVNFTDNSTSSFTSSNPAPLIPIQQTSLGPPRGLHLSGQGQHIGKTTCPPKVETSSGTTHVRERFTDMRIASRRHGHCWVQRDAASAGTHRFNASNERDANKSPGSDQKKETSLLDSLPEANLHAGIRFDSLQRAVAKREIADPNLSFALNAAPAPLCYGYGDQIVWKTWESPNLHYNPLYFEEEGLERYGHHRGDHLQHYVSGIHFFTGVLMLPYKMAVQHPRECEFGLGYYRPGNCNPAYQRGVDHSLRGTAAQGLFIGGLLAL